MGSSPVTMSFPKNSWMVVSPGGRRGKGETLSHVSPLRCSRLAVRRQRKKLISLLPYEIEYSNKLCGICEQLMRIS